MASIRKKLKSQAGVAMVIALVFFLLCVMVGMVIVTAAFVSAGSVALERETWRETEALTSAARLLANDVKGMTFTGAYTKTETVTTTVTQTGTGDDATYTTDVVTKGPTLAQTTEEEAATGLSGSDLLNNDLITALYQTKAGISTSLALKDAAVTLSFTASVPDASGGSKKLENVPDVTGKLTVSEEDYDITAVLTCGDSALTMVFEAKVTESAGTATQETTSTTNDNVSTAVKTTTTPYTTTITWGEPVTTEGGTAP